MPSASAPVPFVDLAIQHQRVADELKPALDEIMSKTAFVLGPDVDAFEQEFADYCHAAYCVGVGNGTDAIELALRAAGVGPGDEVIVPANTFVATAEAVVRAGADLALADCDANYLLDASSAAAAVTPRTRAVVTVDLYGQIADVESIEAAIPPDILLVEDAAQSQGATRRGRHAGSIGSVAATSFYPGKNLGAYGDAGAVVTNSAEIAESVRALRNHGGQRRYEHVLIGTNSRLDTLQAAVLRAKLRHLDDWNVERAVAAQRYADLIGTVDGIVLPQVLDGNSHVWHLYVIRVNHRDRVLEHLQRNGIGCGIHYPKPIHRLAAFAELDLGRVPLPRAETYASEILSLPMFPGITEKQQERVVEVLLEAMQ